MKIQDSDEERPLAWLAVLQHTPVLSAEGEEIGTVKEVVGSETEDIFHGVVIGHGMLSSDVLIPAADVGTITNKQIETRLTAEEVRALPPHVEEDSYQLGFIGMFSKRLGWTREGHGPR